MNRLGLPAAFGGDPHEGLVWRSVIYEALAAINPAFIVAAPGPGMAGFVVANLGDEWQKQIFFSAFRGRPAWSFFALTEPHAGSDAAGIAMWAEPAQGGHWRLRGHKKLIGQAWRADIGVVFARTGPGPLGVAAFLIEPPKLEGLRAERLDTVGFRGINLSHLIFDDVIVADEARLGRHLKATVVASASAPATFDAMRPCVAAIALGIARGALDKAEAAGVVDAAAWAAERLALSAMFLDVLRMSAAGDRGRRAGREAGLVKARASALAEQVLCRIVEAAPAGAAAHPWLAKAWRDVRAVEYTEGVSVLHRLNASSLFMEAGNAVVH